MKLQILAGMAALAIAAAPAFAQGAKKAPAKAMSDPEFVVHVAKSAKAEVELGRLAAEKGISDQVKTFGRKMRDDHTKAGNELRALPLAAKMKLPADVDPKAKATHDRLAKLSGDAFDRAYIKQMVMDHEKAAAAFKAKSEDAMDADLKAWAAKTLATVEEHLRMAQDANRAVGTSGQK